MTILTIHQPNLFPRLKVLQKINRSDIWVVFDDVQFVVREWQNRTRLRFLKKPDREFWLNIPVHRPNGQKSNINTVTICDLNRTKKHFSKVIRHVYYKSEHWDWINTFLNEINKINTLSLSDYCVNSTLICLALLGLNKSIVYSSVLEVEGSRNSKLVNICKKLNAKFYITGSGGLEYLDRSIFKINDIKVETQKWSPPPTLSAWDSLSWRNISFLDYVARCGPNLLKEHLCYWDIN